jgi:hypothetical protein
MQPMQRAADRELITVVHGGGFLSNETSSTRVVVSQKKGSGTMYAR